MTSALLPAFVGIEIIMLHVPRPHGRVAPHVPTANLVVLAVPRIRVGQEVLG